MPRLLALLVVLILAASPAWAELAAGDKAPEFSAPASLAGKPFSFALAEALKKGPVVLYFYPKAFTMGCTIEAHAFSEAADSFAALGATVIGVSNDTIETLNKFSVTECRNKFAVASDSDQAIMKAYDAVMPERPELANRTSFVITPDHRIAYVYSDMSPADHVANTLAAVKAWKEKQGGATQ
jgi:thioredoxin-dependent peroxiredoxin